MVVRIIIADLNDYAFRFREPLGKSNYIRLFSCSLISQFTSFDAYLFPCDLLDKDENLLNGEPSSVLAYFDIVESQF